MGQVSRHRTFVTLLAGLSLVACGGGGGAGGGGGGLVSGIDGTGVAPPPVGSRGTVSFGTVSRFGSIYVNGVRFDTSSSSFSIDGENGSQDDLAIGDVVLVFGSLNSGSTTEGRASRVAFDDAVEGPVQNGSVDPVTNSFAVLGQTVLVTADTLFDDNIATASLSGITDGMIVEVSGFRADDGRISATRIEAKPAGGIFEVTGIVSSLDAANKRFSINSQGIDMASAILDDFPASGVANGDLVEVKGTGFSGDDFVAVRVELKGNDFFDDDHDSAEIEGLITRFTSSSDFEVAGIDVVTNSQTVFEGGVSSDLGLNLKVEVEGALDAGGRLVATKVDIRRDSNVRVMAPVESVDSANGSFTVLGIQVSVEDTSQLEDKRDEIEPFSVSNLANGDYVEVRGAELPAGSNQLLASQVRREDFNPDIELRGYADSISQPDLVIMGVSVSTTAGTVFRDAAETLISASEFFALVAEGSLIEVDGVSPGPGALIAEEIELESQN